MTLWPPVGAPTLHPMAATETRLLLLGTVMLFEPVNGYQLRRELLSWQVEDWAHVNPGLDLLRAGHPRPPGQPRPARRRRRHPRGRRLHEHAAGRRGVRAAVARRRGDRSTCCRRCRSTPAVALMPLMARDDGRRPPCATRLAAPRREGPRPAGRRTGATPRRCHPTCGRWPTSGWAWAQTEREWLVDLVRAGRRRRPRARAASRPTGRRPPTTPGGRWRATGQRYVELIARSADVPTRRPVVEPVGGLRDSRV